MEEKNITKQEAMQMAIEEAKINQLSGYKEGGPFGAVIMKDGKIIAKAHNAVVGDKDPTAHAEIKAIRLASQKLQTHDLSGCILFASGQPCPMCLSAIIWSNIKEVYYANTVKEAEKIGFRDDRIYEYIKGNQKEVLSMEHMPLEEAIKVYEAFEKTDTKTIY